MNDQVDLARGWMRKGDSDLEDARRGVASSGPYDTACFHAQQAAEKYLKAVLALAGEQIPRTHDLVVLYDLCTDIASDMELDRVELADLMPYAVHLRYEIDFWPDRQTAKEALDIAERVRSAVLAHLPPGAHP